MVNDKSKIRVVIKVEGVRSSVPGVPQKRLVVEKRGHQSGGFGRRESHRGTVSGSGMTNRQCNKF